jgi:hypothetical protein
MGHEFRLSGRSGSREQHRGRMRIQSGLERLLDYRDDVLSLRDFPGVSPDSLVIFQPHR